MAGEDLFDRSRERGFVAEFHDAGNCGLPPGDDCRDGLVQGIAIAPVEQHMGAGAGQGVGNLPAQSTCCARDERDFASQYVGHVHPATGAANGSPREARVRSAIDPLSIGRLKLAGLGSDFRAEPARFQPLSR